MQSCLKPCTYRPGVANTDIHWYQESCGEPDVSNSGLRIDGYIHGGEVVGWRAGGVGDQGRPDGSAGVVGPWWGELLSTWGWDVMV